MTARVFFKLRSKWLSLESSVLFVEHGRERRVQPACHAETVEKEKKVSTSFVEGV
jgi:hypothetical protein